MSYFIILYYFIIDYQSKFFRNKIIILLSIIESSVLFYVINYNAYKAAAIYCGVFEKVNTNNFYLEIELKKCYETSIYCKNCPDCHLQGPCTI